MHGKQPQTPVRAQKEKPLVDPVSSLETNGSSRSPFFSTVLLDVSKTVSDVADRVEANPFASVIDGSSTAQTNSAPSALGTSIPKKSEASRDSGVSLDTCYENRRLSELQKPLSNTYLSPVQLSNPRGSYGKVSCGGPTPKTAWLKNSKQPRLEKEVNQGNTNADEEPEWVLHEDGFPSGWDKYDTVMRDEQFNHWISTDARNKAATETRPIYTIPPLEAFADLHKNFSSQYRSLPPLQHDAPRNNFNRHVCKDRYDLMNAKALKTKLQERGLFSGHTFIGPTAASDYNNARQALRDDDANDRRIQVDEAAEAAREERERRGAKAARTQAEEDHKKMKRNAEAYWQRQEERAQRTCQNQEVAEPKNPLKETEQQQPDQASASSNSPSSKSSPRKGTLLSQLLLEIDSTKVANTSVVGIPTPVQTRIPKAASSGPAKITRESTSNKTQDSKTKLDKREDSSNSASISNTAPYARSTKAFDARCNIPVTNSVKSNASKLPRTTSRRPLTSRTAGPTKAGNRDPVTSLGSTSRKDVAPTTGSVLEPANLRGTPYPLEQNTVPESTSKPPRRRRRRLTTEPHPKKEPEKVEGERLKEIKLIDVDKKKEGVTCKIPGAIAADQMVSNIGAMEVQKAEGDGSDGTSSLDRKHKQPNRKRSGDFDEDKDENTRQKRQRSDSGDKSSGDGSSHSHKQTKQSKRKRRDGSDQDEDRNTTNKRQRNDSEKDGIHHAATTRHNSQPAKKKKKYNKPWRNPFINL